MASNRPSALRPTLLAAFGLLLAACSFDASALDDRGPCDDDSDCPSGVCVAGSCYNAGTIGEDAGDDVLDAGDTDPTDSGDASEVGPDVPSDGTECTGDEAYCDGDIAYVCQDGVFVGTDCATACEGDDCVCDAGLCVSASCEPGLRECRGATVVECNTDGNAWDDVETCDDASECIGGECVGACEPGDLTCAGDQLVGCNDDGQPIVEARCPDSDAWCSDEGGAHCEPWTCTPGSTRCTDDASAYEVCGTRGIEWLDGEACGDGEVCDDGECIELDCEPGDTTCVGPFVYSVCEDDGQSSIISSCAEGTFCSDNGDGSITCEDQTCDPGTRRCLDDAEVVEVCDERGEGFTLTIDCDSDQYCREGICTARTCDPGSVRCVGDFAYLTCDDRGAAQVMTTCESGTYCDGSGDAVACVPQVCTPGARQCVSFEEVELCNTAGSGFTESETCDETQACQGGVCTPRICEADAFECTGDFAYRTCNDAGTQWTSATCGDGTYCDGVTDGCEEQACTPDALVCDGDDLLRCNAAGSATTVVETCAYGCSEGACNPAVCGDGIVATEEGELCDDGNDNPCDGCNACVIETGVAIDTSTQTTSTVIWQPNESDFTIEGWVNVAEGGALFGLGDRTASDYAWVGVEDGVAVFEFSLGESTRLRVQGGTTIEDTGWHHIAAVRFDLWGAALFVDGKLDGLVHTPAASRSIDIPTAIWIGSDGNTTPAEAIVDEVRISRIRRYTFPFTPLRAPGTDGNTVARYDFDGGDAGIVTDTSGNGRNLTMSSATRDADACYGAAPTAMGCGDGELASWEECDDGNAAGGDGCSVDCLNEVCPAGERRGPNDHCYYVSSTGRRWSSAESACDDRGDSSDLVLINNELENDWITFFLDLGGSHWIGLYDGDFGDEGSYSWDRGSSDYRNWADGEPNNGGDWGDEDCVVIYGADAGANAGRWNDDSCGNDRPSICERW